MTENLIEDRNGPYFTGNLAVARATLGEDYLVEIAEDGLSGRIVEAPGHPVNYPDGVYCSATGSSEQDTERRLFADWISDINFDNIDEGDELLADLQKVTHEQVVQQIKDEILADVRTGVMPADVADFSALHDHVDANCYGGLCDTNAYYADPSTDAGMADLNRLQDEVNDWIVAGGIAAGLTETTEG